MSRIELDPHFCKGCRLCIAVCPKTVLEISSRRNSRGYPVPIAERPEDCTGCMLCEMTCPEMAITVAKKRKKKGERDAD